MTPGKSFCPGMERLQESHSVLGCNDSRGVLLCWEGTTAVGVILSWGETTPGESFCPGMERLQGNTSVLGWNDSRGVFPSWDGTTPDESYCPAME